MSDNQNNENYENKYGDYFDSVVNNDYSRNKVKRQGNSNTGTNQNLKHNNYRKKRGLKWKLINFKNSLLSKILLVVIILILILVLIFSVSKCSTDKVVKPTVVPTTVAPTTEKTSYKIEGVPVIPQGDLHAACETYACTMLLKSYHFDIDEYKFVDNYLVIKPVSWAADGTMYGPDMDSAYAGDIYTGYGINAIGMAKCMNTFLETTDSKLRAQPLKNVPLEELCKTYINNDIPVMVWATTYMEEPYVKATWVIDYADEDSENKIGDTVSWKMHEHCMVLVGYDKENYIFCDSVSGKLSSYDRKTSEKRYEEIGKQAIYLK